MTYFKDPEDPQWADDAAMKEYKAGMAEHEPKADPLRPSAPTAGPRRRR